MSLYVLGALTFILMFSVTLVYPVLKVFVMDRFHTTATEAGLFVSASLIAYVIFAPIWGALSDRAGKRKAFIVAGLGGNAVLLFLLTKAVSLKMLLVVRFVEGAFTIMAFSLLMTMALDAAKRTRFGAGMGVIGMGMAMGNALGAPVGGMVGGVGVFYPMYLGAILLAVAALVAKAFLREPELKEKQVSVREALALLTEEVRLLIPYLFSFIDRFTVGFFVGVFPLFLGSVHGFSPGEIGKYMAFFLIPFALLQYPGGRLSDRVGRTPPLVLGSLFYGICVAFVGQVDKSMLFLPLFLGGIAGAFMYPPSAALAGDLAHPAKRGVAMGGFNLFGSLGFAIGPFIGGAIADSYGYGATFAFAGASEVIIAIALLPFLLRLRR
jgi:MFS family permease